MNEYSKVSYLIEKTKGHLHTDKITMLCIGDQAVLKDIFLNIFPVAFGVNTCIRKKSSAGIFSYETDRRFAADTEFKESSINLVFVDKSSSDKFVNTFSDKIPLIYYKNGFYEPSISQIYDALLPFTEVDASVFGKDVKAFQKHISTIRTPILLLDKEEGEEIEMTEKIASTFFLDTEYWKNLRMSDTSLYSSAHKEDGKYLVHLLLLLLNQIQDSRGLPEIEHPRIFDTCANVGSNTSFFAGLYSTKVLATEVDPQEFERLRHNMLNVYKFTNVTVKNISCLDQIYEGIRGKTRDYDVMFFDPPWGGPLYKSVDKLVLGLDNRDTVDIIDECIFNDQAHIYVLKHPRNTVIRSMYKNFTVKIYHEQVREFYRLTFWFAPYLNITERPEVLQDLYPDMYYDSYKFSESITSDKWLDLTPTSNKVVKKPYAYVTLVMRGDDYVPGAFATMYSIRETKPDANLVIMVTNDVSERARTTLSQVCDYVVEVDYLAYKSKQMKTAKQKELYESWIEQSYTKWQALRLPFDKVLIIDSDIAVVKNMDHLFSLRAPAAPFNSPFAKPYGKLPNIYDINKGPDGYTIHGAPISPELVMKGLKESKTTTLHGTSVLLAPNLKDYRQFLDMMNKYKDANTAFGFDIHSGFDEQSLALFYASYKKEEFTNIHQRYNFMSWKTWTEEDGYFLVPGDVPYVVHFMSKPKPWNQKLTEDTEWKDVGLWWMIFLAAVKEHPDAELYFSKYIKDACTSSSVEKCYKQASTIATTYMKNIGLI